MFSAELSKILSKLKEISIKLRQENYKHFKEFDK